MSVVELEKDTPAILFSAENSGVSGWSVNLALLVPGTGKNLEDLFVGDMRLSNQSQHAFWSAPTISDAMIFPDRQLCLGAG